jgi:hypothetical protein
MKHICLLCGMMWLALSASAQSLDECRRLAREHYPEIRQYNLITQTEEYNLSNAAKAWIPQVTFSGQATYQSAAPTYPEAFSSMMQTNGIHMTGVQKTNTKLPLMYPNTSGMVASRKPIVPLPKQKQKNYVVKQTFRFTISNHG